MKTSPSRSSRKEGQVKVPLLSESYEYLLVFVMLGVPRMESTSLSSMSSHNAPVRRVVVVSVFLALLLRVDCFLHAPCRAHLEVRHHALQRRVAAAGDQTQDAGQDCVGVPDTLRDRIIEEIEELGGGKVIEVKETTAGPGLHNRHFKYTATGGTFMAKVSKNSNLENFAAERAGLQAILETGCLRAPKPLAHGPLPLGGSFLLMEHMPFIPFGQSIPEVLKHLAEGLAHMHLKDPPPDVTGFGFSQDNYLGMSPQSNAWNSDFASFMVENRLLPQFERAIGKFSTKYGTSNEDASAFQCLGAQIFERTKDVLGPVADAKPSLLHGDLWVGNCGGVPAEARSREAAVFDPACWYGIHEFDLALATMFGGFGAPFYETYHAIIPKAEGFDRRMRIYKLYHYLNHLNLHGAGFGHGGTVEDPRGYFERCVDLMQDIIADED